MRPISCIHIENKKDVVLYVPLRAFISHGTDLHVMFQDLFKIFNPLRFGPPNISQKNHRGHTICII